MTGPNTSSQLLQNFVSSLLSEPEQNNTGSDKPDTEPFKNQQPIYKSAQTDNLKLASQPLLSERLQRAQSLLKTMPKADDIKAKSLQEAVLPEIFAANSLLERPNSITEDEIIIVEEVLDEKIISDENIDELKQETNLEKTKLTQLDLPSPLLNGTPEWGKGTFQTLIFNVGELRLALPLVKLGGIHRLQPKPTPMPENPEWYLGLQADDGGSIAIIDTALWIMPEKYQRAKSKGLDYEFFVLLDDTRWGLACSKVDNTIVLSEDDIRWNNAKSKRPWLAGMLVDEMCALLDVDTLINMLKGNSPSTILEENITNLN